MGEWLFDSKSNKGIGVLVESRRSYLEAYFHCSLCNGKVCPPDVVQGDLLLCNGSKQLLNPVLEPDSVDIQCPVEVVDALFS